MLCFPITFNGKKFCLPVLFLLPYIWPFPWPRHPLGPDDRMPPLEDLIKSLNLTEATQRTVTGLAIVAHGVSLLPAAQQALFRDGLARSVAEQAHLGVPLQQS